jgi:3-oxoacyl-[acyl-carrier protein] reductase
VTVTRPDDVILVTGASRGLGREMSLRFADEGARDEAELESVAAEAAGETLVTPADVPDLAAFEVAVDAAHERFGRIDTLANDVRKSGAPPQPIRNIRFLRTPASAC